jgi:transcriptional regulator with XRE-family HTH domain
MTHYLGQRIKHLRKNKGLTQFDLEKKTGIKREYLSKLENDELNNPTFSTLLKICEGIGIPINELLSGEEGLPVRQEPVINVISGFEKNTEIANSLGDKKFQVIPIISNEFAASNPSYISQHDIIDYTLISSDYLDASTDQHRYRCIRIGADEYSMCPIIEPNSIVCIDSHQRDLTAVNRNIVALRTNEGTCIIRYIRLEKNCILGIPENIKDYSPLIFSVNKQTLVLGKVIWYQSARTCSC